MSFSCLYCHRLLSPDGDGTFMGQRNHYLDELKEFGDDPDAFSFRCKFCQNELVKCCHCSFISKSPIWRVNTRHWQPEHCVVASDNNDGEAATTSFSHGEDNDEDNTTVSDGEEGSVSDESSDDSVIVLTDDNFEFDALAEELLELSIPQSNPDGMDIDDDTLNEGSRMWSRLNEFEKVFGRNSRAAIYFFHQAELFEREAKMTGGLQGIVHRCMAQHRTYEMSDLHTAKRYFLLLKLLHSVAGSLKQEVMDHTCSVIDMMIPNRLPNIPLPKYPKTMDEAKLMIIGPNNNTMTSNLPTEKIINVDSNHAYVSVDNCIDTMMANGIRPCFAQNEFGERNTQGLNGCPFVQWQLDYIRRTVPNPERTAIGWVSLWSDGYLTSYVKQRKNSAWIITLTVSEPSGKRSKDYTHIIGMGPSKIVSHDAVVLHALKETAGLRKVKKRYCGKSNKWIDTVFFLIFYLADRPERNEITYTSQWTGICTKRFMWAAYICSRFLPSCEHCYLRRIKVLLGLTQRSPQGGEQHCTLCCDWNFNAPDSAAWKKTSSDLGKIFGINASSGESKYPNEASRFDSSLTPFPEGRSLPERSHLRPMQQLFDNLKKAVTLAFEQVAIGNWYQYNITAYLKGCGVNQKAIDKAYKAAKEACNELKSINCADARRARLAEMLDPTNLVSIGALPGIWFIEGLTIKQFLEIPMHLLFTGITKDLAQVMDSFVTTNSHSKPFERFMNSLLDGLNQWQLYFAKSQSLPTKRYVSENYLSLARLMPWVYSTYFRNWDPTTSGARFDDVIKIQKLIHSGFVMISHLMRSDQIPIDFIDDCIKIFLSSWDSVESAIGSLISNSMWTKGNQLSLLNLPSQIEMFGNLRWCWDGEKEKSIQQTKKIQTHLRHTQSYFLGKMNLHLQQKSIGIIHEHLIEAGELPNLHQDYEKKKKTYQRFPAAEIHRIVSNGLVLSCLLLKGDRFSNSVYAVESFRRDGVESLRRIKINNIGTVTSLGLVYTGFEVSDDIIEIQCEQMDERTQPCLLLPYANRKEKFSGQFTIITDEWQVLQLDGAIDYPKFTQDLFYV